MRFKRHLLACLLTLSILAAPAKAGILVDGVMEGVPVRFEMGADRTRVLASVGGTQHLIDLAQDNVYVLGVGRAKRVRLGLLDDGASILSYKLDEWSPGPPIAGHGSRYNVLHIGELICGEVLSSHWMLEFIEPVVRSIGLMQRLDPEIRPKKRGDCGAIPFNAYAKNGWPLMAGWKDATAFLTTDVRFDHRTIPGLFDLPRDFVD